MLSKMDSITQYQFQSLAGCRSKETMPCDLCKMLQVVEGI